DRFLPDKAIDLMDEVGSRHNLANSENDEESLENKLNDVVEAKEKAAEKEDYEEAANLRYQEIQLQKQIDKAKEEVHEVQEEVTVEDVQLNVEEKTGIPVTKLQSEAQAQMRDLADTLRMKVIGQDAAVDHVAKAVRRSRAGLKSKTRPIGSFLFVGPTGVGKTELSKVLAEELFGTKDRKSTRLNSSHVSISYAVFCLKKNNRS